MKESMFPKPCAVCKRNIKTLKLYSGYLILSIVFFQFPNSTVNMTI